MPTKLGAPVPNDLWKDPKQLAEFLSALEEMGYNYMSYGDHVLGADPKGRDKWRPYFGKAALFVRSDAHFEPFVRFAYLAAITKTLEFSTGILIMPQRQTALVAKQAAEIDVMSNGRLRLVPAVGWNDVEFEALGVDYHQRGAIMDEQVEVLRLLWTKEVVNYKGKYHTITNAGINPLPIQKPIPIWFGGETEPVLRRTGTVGDGWFPWYPYFNKGRIKRDWATIQAYAKKAKRDPKKIGFQGATYFKDTRFEPQPGDRVNPARNIDEAVEEAHVFKELGATHYSVSALGFGAGGSSDLEANANRAIGKSTQRRASLKSDTLLEGLRKFKEQVGKKF